MIAEGLEALLKDAFDLVGVVHDGQALLEASQRLQPDVIVTDITMPVLNGIDAVRQLLALRSDVKVVILTMHRDTQMAIAALRAGAMGYVLKVSPGEELIAAIQEVAEGRPYVSPLLSKEVFKKLLEPREGAERQERSLTPKQSRVLGLIAEGKTMKQIAAILNISPRTVESHKYEMMQSLGVNTTAELIQFAVRLKMLDQ